MRAALPKRSGATVASGSSSIASISASTSSPSLAPALEKNLMPLSAKGLCEAEMTMPASARKVRVR